MCTGVTKVILGDSEEVCLLVVLEECVEDDLALTFKAVFEDSAALCCLLHTKTD